MRKSDGTKLNLITFLGLYPETALCDFDSFCGGKSYISSQDKSHFSLCDLTTKHFLLLSIYVRYRLANTHTHHYADYKKTITVSSLKK